MYPQAWNMHVCTRYTCSLITKIVLLCQKVTLMYTILHSTIMILNVISIMDRICTDSWWWFFPSDMHRVEFTGIVAREKPVNLGQVSQGWNTLRSVHVPNLLQYTHNLSVLMWVLIFAGATRLPPSWLCAGRTDRDHQEPNAAPVHKRNGRGAFIGNLHLFYVTNNL